MTASGFSLRIKRKSLLRFARSTRSPSLILWAFTIMSLWAAWRKIWVSFTTLKQPESMMSRSTFPGPTLGSWSTSPTNMRRVPTFTARRRECIRLMSTIDISSIMITSASSGFSSFRSKCMPPELKEVFFPEALFPAMEPESGMPEGTSSSILWMVRAS